ncbi:MAG TPA: hypothetical protein VFI02_20045, partial [Armatimonadota bacterium]|nr:hypothetical protein [Armatimonadota bacterium]
MKRQIVLPLLFALASLCIPSQAGLVPNDILLVVNDYPSVAQASQGVAQYYCTERGVPLTNIFHVSTTDLEYILPEDFADTIYKPLMSHLQTHFGADPNDPAACRIKCIVLCYGIPSRITDSVRHCSTDSALTMLFEHAPWGRVAMTISSGTSPGRVLSPYGDDGGTSYLAARGEKPTDFSEFRASAFNEQVETPPNFKIIRFTDPTHAIAGGEQGMLYGGELAGGQWTWTPALDENK